MTYRFPNGTEVSDSLFRRIERIVYRYHTGTISARKFERRMRELGFTRARAYVIYRWVVDGNYEYIPPVKEIEFVDVMVSVSLVTTSSKGPWSQRYFEGRIFAPVPKVYKYDVPGGAVIPIRYCSEVETISDLFIACIFAYFESKGYDVAMLDTADWKAGVKYFKEYKAPEDMDVVFKCEIYDMGSANRPMNIRRWYDEIPMPKRYWVDLEESCRHFREEAFNRGYLKSMGKQVRW